MTGLDRRRPNRPAATNTIASNSVKTTGASIELFNSPSGNSTARTTVVNTTTRAILTAPKYLSIRSARSGSLRSFWGWKDTMCSIRAWTHLKRKPIFSH